MSTVTVKNERIYRAGEVFHYPRYISVELNSFHKLFSKVKGRGYLCYVLCFFK